MRRFDPGSYHHSVRELQKRAGKSAVPESYLNDTGVRSVMRVVAKVVVFAPAVGTPVMLPVPTGSALAPTAFFHLFADQSDLPGSALVLPEWMPQPYRGLLYHHEHMTVKVEEFYGESVDVRVLDNSRDGESYSRKILLELQSDNRVVQFGIVRIDLSYCSPVVRRTILEESTPLGRILIDNNVLRRIEHTGFFRVSPSPQLMRWFGLKGPTATWGRMGVIFCDDKPAIEVLEILAPIPETRSGG